MKTQEELTTLKNQLIFYNHNLQDRLYDISTDFIGDFNGDLSSNNYLDDLITEYSDNATSIYCSDQRNYYFENTDICLEALDMFGYSGESLQTLLKDCGDLDGLICKAGAIGEYYQNENHLQEDKENIAICLLVEYILKNWEELTQNQLKNWDYSEIITICEDININQIDRVSDILDYFQESTQGE